MCNIPWVAIENVEMEQFFSKWLPGSKLPGRKKLSGMYLDAAAKKARALTQSQVRGKLATGSSDGWKTATKVPVIGSLMTVENEVSRWGCDA